MSDKPTKQAGPTIDLEKYKKTVDNEEDKEIIRCELSYLIAEIENYANNPHERFVSIDFADKAKDIIENRIKYFHEQLAQKYKLVNKDKIQVRLSESQKILNKINGLLTEQNSC